MTANDKTALALACFVAWLLATAALADIRLPLPPLAIFARPAPHVLTCTCTETQ